MFLHVDGRSRHGFLQNSDSVLGVDLHFSVSYSEDAGNKSVGISVEAPIKKRNK